jgi:hypothetical protein
MKNGGRTRRGLQIRLAPSLCFLCWIAGATSSHADAFTCFSSAEAVRKETPTAWPSWTLRAPGHEGTKCWYPSTRASARDHRNVSAQRTDHLPDSGRDHRNVPAQQTDQLPDRTRDHQNVPAQRSDQLPDSERDYQNVSAQQTDQLPDKERPELQVEVTGSATSIDTVQFPSPASDPFGSSFEERFSAVCPVVSGKVGYWVLGCRPGPNR